MYEWEVHDTICHSLVSGLIGAFFGAYLGYLGPYTPPPTPPRAVMRVSVVLESSQIGNAYVPNLISRGGAQHVMFCRRSFRYNNSLVGVELII